MASTIAVDILARDRASRTFDKVGRASSGLGSKIGSMGAAVAMGAGVAAVGGIAALGAAMVQGVKDAASYQDLQNRTRSVLKSTGNAAGTSVKGIQSLAAALETMSGVDEELIINSQNVLATFTQIQNKAGRGNDIFNQATKTALDMSTALGTDLQGASIQVGKALNNPIKGVTALQRVGVSFTDAQKKQIKQLVESGKTMDAQKLILAELRKEFGGAAKAAGQGFNGSMARLKDRLSDAARAVGFQLLPYITRLADWMAQKLPGAIDATTRLVQRLHGWWSTKLAPALRTAGQQIMPALKKAWDMVTSSVGGGTVSWRQIGDIIVNKVIPAVTTIAKVALPVLGAMIRNAITQWKMFGQAIRAIWSVAAPVFRLIANTFYTVVGAIVNGAARAFGWVPGLGPKLRGAAAQFNTFRDQVNRALNGTRSYKRITFSAPGSSAVIQRLAKIRWQLDRIPRSVTIGVNNKLARMPGFATGVSNFSGGVAMVGERGPELVNLPKGSSVSTARETAAMMGEGGGTTVVQLVLDGRVVEEVLLGRKRRRGGVALGL